MERYKEVILGTEARNGILRGVQTLAGAVKSTLGPRGRNVILDRGVATPLITKDGITVAKHIALKNKLEGLGARLVREAASRTSDTAGDGTTTATVLAEAIYSKGIRQLEAGADPMALRRGIGKVLPLVLEYLKDMTISIGDDPEKIRQVGVIAANGETLIGDLLVQAFQKVGRDGVITLEEAKGFETTIELIEGLQFDRGYLSPYFCNDFQTFEAVYDDVYILLSDKRIDQARDIVPILTTAKNNDKPIIIIADDFSNEVLQVLIINRTKIGLPVVAIKAPGFGTRKQDNIDDLAAITGATVVGDRTGVQFKNVTTAHMGQAQKIIVKREETIILEGAGDPQMIDKRVQWIKKEISELDERGAIQKDFLEARLAKLTAGIARIRAGGMTEIEMQERRDRIEDALNATRAAIEEGILPGGGVALLRAARALELESLDLTADEAYGAKILLEALEAPIRQIANNAGTSDELVVTKLIDDVDRYVGYNAATDDFVNMMGCGVIDPAKVVRLALENAASVASTMLTTECLVAELPEEEQEPKPSQPGMR